MQGAEHGGITVTVHLIIKIIKCTVTVIPHLRPGAANRHHPGYPFAHPGCDVGNAEQLDCFPSQPQTGLQYASQNSSSVQPTEKLNGSPRLT
jgi:hypothetical protein